MASGKTPARFQVVGKAHRKVDATAKVTGITRFADDLFLPRMLFAKLLRSPHPTRASSRSTPLGPLAYRA